MKLSLLVILTILVSCSDAEMSKIGSWGSSAKIKCYSGGLVIYDGHSTGKVISEANSDGYFFRDKGDGNLKEVSGNCVIEYK